MLAECGVANNIETKAKEEMTTEQKELWERHAKALIIITIYNLLCFI